MIFNKEEDRKWTIIKLFKRLLHFNTSVFDRQFLMDPIWLIQKIGYYFKDKEIQFEFSSEEIHYIKELIENDPILKKKQKEIINQKIDLSKKKRRNETNNLFDEILKEINDLKSSNSYYKKIEDKTKKIINEFIENPHISENIYKIKNIIGLFISTRINLGFSTELMNDFIKRERKYLEKDKSKVFLENFWEKFKYKNVFKKEKYSIFIPINTKKEHFHDLKRININNVKICWYSYPESKMNSPINKLTKNFKKDTLYLAFEEKEGIDWITLTNKILWEKAVNFMAIINMYSIHITFDTSSPLIVLKNLKNKKSKVEEYFWKLNINLETDTLFSKKAINSYQILDNGLFKEKTSKFKSFLRAKFEFEKSINPIERINLSSRALELYCKYPFKRAYGNETKFETIRNTINKSLNTLIYNHNSNIIWRNFKDLCNYLDEKNLLKSSNHYDIKKLIKKIKNIDKDFIKNIENMWSKNLIKELKGISRLPKKTKNKFKSFLNLSSLIITIDRNKQIHNKSSYKLKEIMLSEIVDSILSASAKKDFFELWKKIEKNP